MYKVAVDFDAPLHRPVFEVFGIAATYTPPGGGSAIACAGNPAVRRSELPVPAKQGTLAIGSEMLTVLEMRAATIPPGMSGCIRQLGKDAEAALEALEPRT